ncbi:MAG: hypothetical protein JWM10_543 [Myxococcaceae bacterium]|nr:hypothetical protein [Myxococcaceae bacterium]
MLVVASRHEVRRLQRMCPNPLTLEKTWEIARQSPPFGSTLRDPAIIADPTETPPQGRG